MSEDLYQSLFKYGNLSSDFNNTVANNCELRANHAARILAFFFFKDVVRSCSISQFYDLRTHIPSDLLINNCMFVSSS